LFGIGLEAQDLHGSRSTARNKSKGHALGELEIEPSPSTVQKGLQLSASRNGEGREKRRGNHQTPVASVFHEKAGSICSQAFSRDLHCLSG
jgi:hypothetical protein